MHLLIDLGNSRLKWAQSGPGVWLTGAVLHRDRDLIDVLDNAWAALPAPDTVVLVTVAAPDLGAALEFWLQDRWARTPHRLTAQREQLGVTNLYREPATLGADRWAALIAAREITDKACVVVGCGTAVTVDVLSNDGKFLGGVILSGLALSRQSLDKGTAGIGAQLGSDTNCLAQSTADAVTAGTLYGLAGAIERCVHEQEHVLGETLEILITGGDAPLLAPRIRRPVTEIPDLVLKGLARVAEEL
jgi:type III pantothenate kinase